MNAATPLGSRGRSVISSAAHMHANINTTGSIDAHTAHTAATATATAGDIASAVNPTIVPGMIVSHFTHTDLGTAGTG